MLKICFVLLNAIILSTLQDFTGLNVEHFENYVLIISAMEDNYASYLKMKEELIEVNSHYKSLCLQ